MRLVREEMAEVDGAAPSRSPLVEHLRADPAAFATSPAVLAGSVDRCVDLLVERRAHGISYVNLRSHIESVAPIVARLAGR